MEDRTNTLQCDYGTSSFPYKETEEDREWNLREHKYTLRYYYGENISFTEGKEELMARSVEEAIGFFREKEMLKWIKNGWMWYNEIKERWEYLDKEYEEKWLANRF